MGTWQFFIDRGGTFTDIVARAPDGRLVTTKLLSENPENYEDAAIAGIADLIGMPRRKRLPPDQIGSVRMGTTILNGAKIGSNCLVGANALITERKEFPDNSVILGAPAKAVREVDDKARAMIVRGADVYVKRWKQYAAGLKRIA